MDDLAFAIRLRSEEKLQESNALLKKLAAASPDDPMLNYQCAWSFDVLGQESEAIAYYERAIALGLIGEDLKGAYLGLGSTYRSIGAYTKSKAILQSGIDAFPEDNALKTFYAMAIYHLGEHARSIEILLNVIAETSSAPEIIEYRKAIIQYACDIDRVWK